MGEHDPKREGPGDYQPGDTVGPNGSFVSPATAFRSIDPAARELWDVQGPRDTGGRIQCWLVKVSRVRIEVLVHVFPEVQWKLYGEIDVDGSDDVKAALDALIAI